MIKNYLRPNRRPTTTFSDTANKSEQESRDCARIVYPSQWALLDVVCLPVFQLLFKEGTGFRSDLSIEDAPFIKYNNRRHFLSGTSTVWATFNNTILPAYPDEHLDFPCSKVNNYTRSVLKDGYWIDSSDSQDCIVKGALGKIWCVRSSLACDRSTSPSIAHHEFSSATEYMSTNELCLFYSTYLSTHSFDNYCPDNRAPIGDQSPSYKRLFTFPGDICTIVRPRSPHMNQHNSRYICLFIASFLWREGGKIVEQIVWIAANLLHEHCKANVLQHSQVYAQRSHEFVFDNNSFLNHLQNYSYANETVGILHQSANGIPVAAWTTVTNLPIFPSAFAPRASLDTGKTVRNQGVLSNGTPYYIYRFILYTDGFKQKKSISDLRSVCGCYIMPAGLPQHCRCSSSSARIIKLGAHGQDSNELLEFVVDDIAKGCIHGLDGFDPYGRLVMIFLDAVAIIGDYPAVTAGTDLSGHTSDTFCSFCVIKKRKGGLSSEVLYSSELHSGYRP